MTGITRIQIISDWKDWRTKMSEDFAPIADVIYREAFENIGIELDKGLEIVHVSKEEAKARYDWSEGIDVILKSTAGARMTLQEKFLTYWENTATFEEHKTSGAQGAWYYCTAQYYFVGYARLYWDFIKRELVEHPKLEFQDWILLDFPAVHRSDALGILDWHRNQNGKDGRGSTFRYIYFEDIPTNCIVSQKRDYQKQPTLLSL